MKPDDLRGDSFQNALSKPRVLAALLVGSFALHLLVLWVIAQFPALPAKAPETLIEVQLRDLPAVTPEVTKVPKPPATPRLGQASRPVEMPPRGAPLPPILPRPERREITPTAPLVRSTREVSKTGIVAKKPSSKPAFPLPTAAPRAQNPAPTSQSAPDTILPRPQNSKPQPAPATETPLPATPQLTTPPLPTPQTTPTTQTQPAKPTLIPTPIGDTGESQKQASKNNGNTDLVRGPDKKEKRQNTRVAKASKIEENADPGATNGSDNAAKNDDLGPFGLESGPFGIAQKPRPSRPQVSKPSPTFNGGQGNGNGRGSQAKDRGLGADKPRREVGKPGSGGPFGVDSGAGEGPRRIVYILDISYSMEPRLERAKQELRDALSGLQTSESFNIVAFYGNVRPFEQRMVEATPRNIDKGRAFINALRLERYTNLERAFEQAFAAPGVNVVVLITDGVPTDGSGSPDFSGTGKPNISANFDKLARRVRELNVSRARIYTVGLTGKNLDGTTDKFEAAALLQQIAAESGGASRTVRVDPTPQKY